MKNIREHFETFNQFIEYYKTFNVNINLENEKIKKRLLEIYDGCNDKFYKTTITTFIYKTFPFKNKNFRTVEFWIERGYDEIFSTNKVFEVQSKSSLLVKNRKNLSYNTGYSKDFFKKRSHLSIEYWNDKGYTKEEGRDKINKIQTKNSLEKTKKLKKEPDKYKKSFNTKIEFWIDKGFNEEDALIMLKNRQSTFSLKKCIEKYGEIIGYEKWKERQQKWQETLFNNGNIKSGYSKISQECFDVVKNYYKNEDKKFLLYALNGGEYTIQHNGYNYIYDFCDLKNKKIIEFHGDNYHANPQKYNKNDKPHPYKDKLAKDIWKYDKRKKSIAIKNGFEVEIIWESEYKKNKKLVLENIKKFLKL